MNHRLNSLVRQSACYGLCYYEQDGSACLFAEGCAVSARCRMLTEAHLKDLKKADKKSVGKKRRYEKRSLEVDEKVFGGKMFVHLRSELQKMGYNCYLRSQYVNVVKKGERDKKRSRLLRIWPKKFVVVVYIKEEMRGLLKAYGFGVTDFSEQRKKTFTPHTCSIRMEDMEEVGLFLTAINSFIVYENK